MDGVTAEKRALLERIKALSPGHKLVLAGQLMEAGKVDLALALAETAVDEAMAVKGCRF